MEFLPELTKFISNKPGQYEEFLDKFFTRSLAASEPSELDNAVKTAIEIERIYGIHIPEKLLGCKSNDKVIDQVISEIPQGISITAIDVMNSGFCQRYANSNPNAIVRTYVANDAEARCLKLRAPQVAFDVLSPLTETIDDTKYNIVFCDLASKNLNEDNETFYDICQDKLKKALKQEKDNTKYAQQLNSIKESESAKVKTTIKQCSAELKQAESRFDTKCSNFTSCGILLCMHLLESDGTAYVIVDSSFMTNKTNQPIRKALLTKFNVTNIEQVGPKTSMIRFENNTADRETAKLQFSTYVFETFTQDIIAEDENGYLKINKVKGDIMGITYKIDGTVNLTDIENGNGKYELLLPSYKKTVITPSAGFTLNKIEMIAEIESANHSDEFMRESGNFKFYSSNSVKFCDSADFSDAIILTPNNIYYDSGKFSCSSDCVVITKTVSIPFLFMALTAFKQMICNGKRLTVAGVSKFKVPVPTDITELNGWIDRASQKQGISDTIEEYYEKSIVNL